MSGAFVYFFFQWLSTILAVRLAGFSEAGVYSLSSSFAGVFSVIANFGVIRYQLSDIQRRHTDGTFFAARALTCFFSLVLFLASLLFANFSKYTVSCCLAMLCFKFAESVTDVFFGTLQRFNRYAVISLSYMLKGVFPLAAFCVVLYYTNLFRAIMAMSAVYALPLALLDIPAIIRNKNFAPAVTLRDIPRLLSACFPLALAALVYPCMTFITRYTVNALYSAEELGYYSSVTVLVVVMAVLANSAWNVLVPHITKQYGEKRYGVLKKTMVKIVCAIILGGTFLTLAGFVFGGRGLALVFGEKILPYVCLLTPTFIVSTIWTAVSFFNTALAAFRKRLPLLACNMAGVALCALLVRPFVERFGMAGSCYCLIAGMGLQVVLLAAVYLNAIK
jgi:O-antigen/teichoic acid export membrane protein